MSDKQQIYLHNTLSGKKELFTPICEKQVTLYACGPTVYDFAHIGNFRSFLLTDILCRTLNYFDYNVIKVQNITDVGHLTDDDLADSEGEDKIAKKARVENKNPFEIARSFETFFIEDEKTLNIIPPDHRPRATDYIPEQIKFIEELIQKDFAYESHNSVYFRTTKFKDYGKLSKNNLDNLIAGARVEINTEKEDPLDFALWKHAEPKHLMQWESPWGKGFPGWHIECSAMSKALFGDHFDIHTGGEDNIFPHHECEIAQNEACSGHKSVNYWLHGKHLLVDGKKMSKSKGNFFTIKDLVKKGFTGPEIRFALTGAHYRSALNFTESSLLQARSSIKRLQDALKTLENHQDQSNNSSSDTDWINEAISKYQKALSDDLNIAEALAVTFEIINNTFKKRENQTLSQAESKAVIDFLVQDFNQIFAVLEIEEVSEIPNEVQLLVNERQLARDNKDWAQADQLRDQIKQAGYNVIDESGSQRCEKI